MVSYKGESWVKNYSCGRKRRKRRKIALKEGTKIKRQKWSKQSIENVNVPYYQRNGFLGQTSLMLRRFPLMMMSRTKERAEIFRRVRRWTPSPEEMITDVLPVSVTEVKCTAVFQWVPVMQENKAMKNLLYGSRSLFGVYEWWMTPNLFRKSTKGVQRWIPRENKLDLHFETDS